MLIYESNHIGSYVQIETGPLGCEFIVPTNPTTTMASLDFTDDIQELFDPERHRFTFENREVAQEFAAINQDRRWDPNTQKARLTAAMRWAVIVAIVVFGLYCFITGK